MTKFEDTVKEMESQVQDLEEDLAKKAEKLDEEGKERAKALVEKTEEAIKSSIEKVKNIITDVQEDEKIQAAAHSGRVRGGPEGTGPRRAVCSRRGRISVRAAD